MAHDKDPNCAACHQLMDPLGFGLEAFDGIGVYRTAEKGKPIDSTGTLTGVKDGKMFSDARGLATSLLETEEVQRCIATMWTRYALGRHESDADAPSVDFAQARFRASGLDIKNLLQSIVASRAFRYRGLDL